MFKYIVKICVKLYNSTYVLMCIIFMPVYHQLGYLIISFINSAQMAYVPIN